MYEFVGVAVFLVLDRFFVGGCGSGVLMGDSEIRLVLVSGDAPRGTSPPLLCARQDGSVPHPAQLHLQGLSGLGDWNK